jgi:hypothetical protein
VTSDLDEANLTNMLEDGGVAVMEQAEEEDLQDLMVGGLIPGTDGSNGEMGEGELEGFQAWTGEDDSAS